MKTYTEDQLKLALEYQKAECYQIVGTFLIGTNTPNVEDALNYLCNDKTVDIIELDDMLNTIN